jgi:hypothetical protein
MRLISTVLLIVVSVPAWAEWVEAGRYPTSTVYFDPSTVRKAGNRVKMWDLVDHKRQKTWGIIKPYLSVRTQSEYDCKEERLRTLYFDWHSGNMVSGEIVYTDADSKKWEPLQPRSANELLWKIACGKL